MHANVVRALLTDWCHEVNKKPDADFKVWFQAYDTIPREALWQHLCRISMPTSLLSVIQDMYAGDKSALKVGAKTAYVHPTRGVKQGCEGAVTGTEDVRVTHMLYADGLTLLSSEAGALSTMLCWLNLYPKKKYLIINTVKLEVVHLHALRKGPLTSKLARASTEVL
eukprot:1138871-Pelagomonas_calceolata.AAC.3